MEPSKEAEEAMTETEWTPERMLPFSMGFKFHGWIIQQGHPLANDGCWTVCSESERWFLDLNGDYVNRDVLRPSNPVNRADVSFDHLKDAFAAATKAYNEDLAERAKRNH